MVIGVDGYVVDLDGQTCSCREWQISGIPCAHACASIHFMRKDPADFVHRYIILHNYILLLVLADFYSILIFCFLHRYYTVERYIQAYQYGIQPLNGKSMWPITDGEPIKPPPYKKMPGRPKKMRKRGPEENPRNPSKLTRHGIQMTCSVCGVVGHNKKSCPNAKDPNFKRPVKLPVSPNIFIAFL